MKNLVRFFLPLVFSFGAAGQPYLSWEDSLGTANTDYFARLTIDQSGRLFASGLSRLSGQWHMVSMEYNAAGQRVSTDWSGVYSYSVRDMVRDNSGNIYVTGTGINSIGIYTAKYDTAGVLIWSHLYHGPDSIIDDGRAIVLDAAGNVCVTGYVTVANISHYVVLKYDNSGQLLWDVMDNWGISSAAYGITTDAAGNIYVCGGAITLSSNSSQVFATAKYSSSGQLLAANTGYLPANVFGEARDISVDASQQVYITGFASPGISGGTADIYTLKLDTALQSLWLESYDSFGGQTGCQDEAYDLTLDNAGNVYVTGWVQTDTASGNNLHDVLVIKYDNAGNELWHTVRGHANSGDYSTDILVDPVTQKIYVSGGWRNNVTNTDDFRVICWCQTLPCSEFAGLPETAQDEALQIFPNPASGVTTIRLSEGIQNAALEIFDARGSLLEKRNVISGTMTVDVSAYGEGLYLLVLRDSRGMLGRKLLIKAND